jgi:cysteinyl-tRNA synthetase
MGGIEHISIHHTNEIAQSEAVNNAPLANYWLHNEHLLVDNKKMSKSEGTSYSLEEIKTKGFDPLALRYLFLSAHYRSKQNFTWEALSSAQNGLHNIYRQIKELKNVSPALPDESFKEDFIKTITDDFNIPKALAVIQEVLKSDLVADKKLATLLDFDKVLGLKLAEAISKKETDTEIPEYVLEIKKERDDARAQKDWQKSDELRKEIEREGYILEDSNTGSTIRKTN